MARGCLLSLFGKKKKEQKSVEIKKEILYSKKKSLMTASEKKFYDLFASEIERQYIIIPQVNLATVINKESESRYQNELYRNIDFGIFTKDYEIKLLIELNDSTHSTPQRAKRDKQVKEICSKARIPLITFYTDKPNKKDYVIKRIQENLK